MVLTALLAFACLVQDPAALARDLVGDDLAGRERAQQQLAQLGRAALPALRAQRERLTDSVRRDRCDERIATIELADPGRLQIAFTRGAGLQSELWLWEDGREQRLTGDRTMEAQPALSPDGCKLAFARTAGELTAWDAYELAVLDLSTRSVTALGNGRAPQWSRDGASLLCGVGNAIERRAILGKGKAVAQPFARVSSPVYSLDVAAAADRLIVEADGGIAWFDAATAARDAVTTPVPKGMHGIYAASLAADGSALAMVAGNGPYEWQLYVATAGDTAPRQLTTKPFAHGIAAMAPRGDRIALVHGSSEPAAIDLIDVATGVAVRLDESGALLLRPSWSPDGELLVMVDGNRDLRLVHAASRRSRVLARMDVGYGAAQTWFAPAVRFARAGGG